MITIEIGVTIIVIALLSTRINPSALDAPPGKGALSSCGSSIIAECRQVVQINAQSIRSSCCSELDHAALYDKGCFCSVIDTELLSRCDVPGTVDSLCPGSNTFNQTQSTTQSSGTKIKVIIGISVAVFALVASFIISGVIFIKMKSKRNMANYTHNEPNDVNCADAASNVASYSHHENKSKTITIEADLPAVLAGTNEDGFMTPESLQYKLADLQAATNNFSKENKIGQGGFGIVYKGMLANGQQIAVKRLSNGSSQGEKEFQTEVVLLSKLQHRNLVRLLGFCLSDDEALLMYEFVVNKSLDYYLFDSTRRAELNWPCRFKIIKGIARGMMYLHEDSSIRTLHRDLKAGNILLDAEMYPKIADFGLARICDVGQTHINPTRVVGTHGYMAPEYLFHGQFSAKSDVYAFGVLILEIISGRRITSAETNQPGGESLLNSAWRRWEDENPLEFLDPIIRNSFSTEEVIKCFHLGLLCVEEDSKLRPTMSTIVHMLNPYSVVATLPMPQHPAFIHDRS